jgi:hypothetical protein
MKSKYGSLHAWFDNKLKLLILELKTLDKLENEPQMQKFLVWIRKQDPQISEFQSIAKRQRSTRSSRSFVK